ncbi:MAG: FG-GAP repeat protein [Phycisphaerae bacterium]|nr:FG-GAP repeat protein [Phycisphaerae bacterium]
MSVLTRSTAYLRRSSLLFLPVAIALLTAGCPTVPTDNNNGNDNGTGSGTIAGDIISVRTDRQISALDSFISILYSVSNAPATSDVEAYYVPVIGTPPNLVEEGERVTIAQGLDVGTNQAFQFDPGVAGVGSYQVGLVVTPPTGSPVEIKSRGRIQVLGPPDPMFIQPLESPTEVLQGESVFVSFDVGDPEDDAQWRLFLLSDTDPRDVPADQLGSELNTGRNNVGSYTLATDDLNPGDYQLGISATDSGDSVARTVARGEEDKIITNTNGPVIRVVEVVPTSPPTIRVTAPPAAGVTLFRNEGYTVRFEAALGEPATSAFVEVFYDNNSTIADGFIDFVPNGDSLPVTGDSVAFPTDLLEGTYYVGATIRQQGQSPLTSYAPGTIRVVRQATLTVTAPNTLLPIAPSTGDSEDAQTVTVRWQTNVPPSAGSVDVFARRLNMDGNPTGSEIPILTDAELTVTSTEFSSPSSGLFRIYVRIDFTDPLVTDLVVSAPLPVRVTSLPRVLWLGALDQTNPPFEGAIFEGVNFEDNAGTSFSPVGDLNDDDRDEFLIGARYGKPFFQNPTGVGVGEAYLLYGASGARKLEGRYNLNSVGTTLLPGVTFAGVRTPQESNDTDGMSSISRLPDVDGDGRDELVFGFPDTASRGHNVDPEQNGVVDPHSLMTLEREDQFLRGGVVVVSSQNSIFRQSTPTQNTINLDLVGQDFDVTCAQREPEDRADAQVWGAAVLDIYSPPQNGCTGSCAQPSSGGASDATQYYRFGFVSALARHYFATYVYSRDLYGGTPDCSEPAPFWGNGCLGTIEMTYCGGLGGPCEPFSPGLYTFAEDPDGPTDPAGFTTFTRTSGFYPAFLPNPNNDNTSIANSPREPFGARVIGVGLSDKFGTSLTLSNATGTGAGDIIVSSPNRTARGILLGPAGGPEAGGEIDGLGSETAAESGVAYIFGLRSLWTASGGRFPPKPHQYIVGEASHCGGPIPLIPNIEAIRIAGFTGDRITNIVGIDDFNSDGRDDIAVGAPTANDGNGRIYIAFRRSPAIEGDYVLEKLSLDPNNPERLAGVLIVSNSTAAFGASLTTGVDFNGDGLNDLVVGSPNASGGIGEIIVVFGDPQLVSPAGGISLTTLLTTRNAQGRPRAVRITGNALDTTGRFGFNVANAGDVDGDGKNDLLISAPNGTPRFDPNPTDADDVLSEPGIDADFDGSSDTVNDLTAAGLVYVVSSRNRLDQIRTCTTSGDACSSSADCAAGEQCQMPANMSISIDQLGSAQLRGFMIAGIRAGDRIGGGDAGDSAAGGIDGKVGRGRSFGLSMAGDVDGDGRGDILIGSVLADPRRDPNTDIGVQNAGEAYLVYGSAAP